MPSNLPTININFLDHVAIRVNDLNAAAEWYEKVLGLKKYQLPKWGAYPIFLLAGKSGIALFPKMNLPQKEKIRIEKISVDHFAFNVDQENFKMAQERYDRLGLEYEVKDHFYFHSIYTKDPDGHIVELTTIMVDEATFYK